MAHQGQAIRFPESEVRAMGRPAHGVWAMDLSEGDYLIGGGGNIANKESQAHK